MKELQVVLDSNRHNFVFLHYPHLTVEKAIVRDTNGKEWVFFREHCEVSEISDISGEYDYDIDADRWAMEDDHDNIISLNSLLYLSSLIAE